MTINNNCPACQNKEAIKRFDDAMHREMLRKCFHQAEFDDFYQVLEFGACKHGKENYLEPDGSKCSEKDMMASIFRHAAHASSGLRADPETGIHPLLHAASRCLMLYLRHKRGIVHPEDLR